MEYAVVVTEDEDVLEPWHLPERITKEDNKEDDDAAGVATPANEEAPGSPPGAGQQPLAEELRALERQRMVEALAATGGVKAHAAELLAMPIRTFAMKCKQYGL
jgi:DNA-binding NtrC family response regulator